MNEILIAETDRLVSTLYLAIREPHLSKDQIRDIENSLSMHIFKTEEGIQRSKNNETSELTNELHRRRSILKRLSDGLAWIVFDYNSRLISAASIGHSPGFMVGKQGYQYERNVINALYKDPEIKSAIQCDITNVLRMGDIFAVQNNGSIIPIEIKGSQSGRAHRQIKRYREILEFANTGKYKYKGWNSSILHLQSYQLHHKFIHYWKELDELSILAREKGIACITLDECVKMAVFDREFLDKSQISVKGISEWRGDKVTFRSLSRHLSKNQSILPRARLPITVFPISQSTGLRFILGQLDAIILLNITKALHMLSENGLVCKEMDNGTTQVKTQNGIVFSIEDAWEKILIELVTIPNYVEYVVASAEEMDSSILKWKL